MTAGIQVDNSKVEAILNIGKSSNEKELHKFLSSVNYLGRFNENLFVRRTPLGILLTKDTEEIWEKNSLQDLAFENLKQLITQAPVLRYFDPNSPVELSTDAGQYGLDDHISRNDHPIVF